MTLMLLLSLILLSMVRRLPRPTLFPYTTLFRSVNRGNPRSTGRPRCGQQQRLQEAPGSGDRRRRLRRSEEHTSELQSLRHLVCRLLLEKKKTQHRVGYGTEKTCTMRVIEYTSTC